MQPSNVFRVDTDARSSTSERAGQIHVSRRFTSSLQLLERVGRPRDEREVQYRPSAGFSDLYIAACMGCYLQVAKRNASVVVPPVLGGKRRYSTTIGFEPMRETAFDKRIEEFESNPLTARARCLDQLSADAFSLFYPDIGHNTRANSTAALHVI